jgi:hypothetical protein
LARADRIVDDQVGKGKRPGKGRDVRQSDAVGPRGDADGGNRGVFAGFQADVGILEIDLVDDGVIVIDSGYRIVLKLFGRVLENGDDGGREDSRGIPDLVGTPVEDELMALGRGLEANHDRIPLDLGAYRIDTVGLFRQGGRGFRRFLELGFDGDGRTVLEGDENLVQFPRRVEDEDGVIIFAFLGGFILEFPRA